MVNGFDSIFNRSIVKTKCFNGITTDKFLKRYESF